MITRALAKGLTPPIVLDLYRRWSGRSLRFSGQPRDWEEATRLSSGYMAAGILERVTAATRAVVSGTACFERDSVLFDEPEFPFAVLAALCRAAGAGDSLEVIDFGGSLGSTYRQCSNFLGHLQRLQWRVIEQASFVEVGRREFTTAQLSFHGSLAELPASNGARAVIVSSVLQYLEEPYGTLNSLACLNADYLVIDRTPMIEADVDRLCIQHVPEQIYAASYPCRLIARQKLLRSLNARWRLLCDFTCSGSAMITDDGVHFELRGMILEKKT